MQSMRVPLGSLDTRLTMTDSLADGLLSPSFASVLAFDGSPYDGQAPDEMGSHARDTEQAYQAMADDARESPRRSYPRLELDATLDKYHALDGIAEPLNPQNTPASNSGHDSPDEAGRRRKTDNLRTTSAPHLTLRWFESQPDGSLLFLPSDGGDGARTQKRRFSADDEPRPTTLPENNDQPTGVKLLENSDDLSPPFRCVRFTPPPEPPQLRSPRLAHRPLPSVERKQDYIASYKQQKQFEKWKGPNRALAQRLSPYRSPAKVSRFVRPSNQESNIHSTPSKLPIRPDESPTDLAQNMSEDIASGSRDPGTKDAADSSEGALARQIYDLVAVTLCVYRFRYPGSDPRGGVFHIRMDSTVIPTSQLLQETGKESKAVVRTGIDDLLLHTCVIMPAFVLRVPLAILSAIRQFAHSRVALVTINVLRILWAISVRFLVMIISRLLGRDVAYHAEMDPEKCRRRQRHR